VSVNVLFCEGAPTSPDARVLAKILAGLCEVRPSGSKYGMGDRILARREAMGQDVVFGLLDGDFREWAHPNETPDPWQININNTSIHVGWRWQRKEIENYLIDPRIVDRTLGIELQGYTQSLDRAALSIATYEAARIALTFVRPRLLPLPNAFGSPHGSDKHPLPDSISDEICLEEIKQLVTTWNANRTVDPQLVEQAFRRILPECVGVGARITNYLTGFAGKDLLWAMENDIGEFSYPSPRIFLEKIMNGIETSNEDVWTWLPEWSALRQEIVEL